MLLFMYYKRPKQGAPPTRFNRAKGAVLSALLGLAIIAPAGVLVYVGFFEDVAPVEPNMYTLDTVEGEPVSLPWPSDGVAAVGAKGYGVLETHGSADQPVPIASITKLFAALAIMEEKPFELGEDGETISITQADVEIYEDYVRQDGSTYPVDNGQQLTQYQAMQAMLIPSANNVADTMVTWAFGSEAAYLEYVNAMVAEMGLEDTIIADASGFSPESISTPSDLVLAGQAALDDPIIASIVSQSQADIVPGVETVYSTNQLLLEPSVVGIKTGTTDEAGANLLFAAEYELTETQKMTVIGVLLGQSNHEAVFSGSRSLLQAAYQGFDFIQVLEEETTVGVYEVPWAEDVPILSSGGAIVPGWKGADHTPEVEAEALEPGHEPGKQIGSLHIQHGKETTSLPLTTQGYIPQPSYWWKLRNFVGL